LVVLAALGAFMLTFSNTQQLTSAQDVQGSRAYWAARAGLEWGIGSVFPLASAAAVCPASPTTLAIDTFSVTITCSVLSYNEAGVTVKIFKFVSVASSAGAAGSRGFIERSVSASLEK
jgi:MSHA biogenesis protein MshP